MKVKEVAEIIKRQRDYFSKGKTKDLDFRLEMLKRLKGVIEEYEDRITRALYEDLRKSPFEAYASEIGIIKEELKHHLRRLRRWAKPKRVKTPMVHFLASSFIYPEPYGVVLIIAPWNYPFTLLFAPLIGAISAGNCPVLKPSNYSPATSAVMEEMITRSFDRDYISIFQGGREMNQALLKQQFDYIFFTGSPGLGRTVMEAASRHLTPVTLELGGKNPCVIDRSANIEHSARRIVWGKFLNAGQTCLAPDYLLVDKTIKEELTEALKKYIKQFFGENPAESPDFPRIVNDKSFKRLSGLLGSGSVLSGGETDREARYIAPTVMEGITAEDPIMQQEIFGPILPILQYESLEEAIAFIKARPKALACYFFSDNRKKQDMFLQNTSAGGGCLNDTLMHFANAYLPFGGVGNSGMGAYHGHASFDTFSHKKSILKKSNLLDIRLRYAPYRGKLKMLKRFMK